MALWGVIVTLQFIYEVSQEHPLVDRMSRGVFLNTLQSLMTPQKPVTLLTINLMHCQRIYDLF